MKRNYWIKIIISFVLLALLSGCWDSRDINYRSTPILMGVTKDEDLYHVYLIIPVSVVSEQRNLAKVDGKGATIVDAIEQIKKKIETTIDLEHIGFVVLGEELGREGIGKIINTFMRMRDMPATPTVAFTKEDMDTYIDQMINTFQKVGVPIFGFLEKQTGWEIYSPEVSLWQVYRGIHSYTSDIAVPIISSNENLEMDYFGASVLKNGKIVETLDDLEVLLMNLLNNEENVIKTFITIDETTDVELVEREVEYDYKYNDDEIDLTIKLEFVMIVAEAEDHLDDEDIQKKFEEKVEKDTLQLVKKLQDKHADVLGISNRIRKNYTHNELKNFLNETYPNINVKVEVEAVIENNGKIRNLNNDDFEDWDKQKQD
ncbi:MULTISPECIES: Ger(x)C family spore germination protein [Oceanobacillus]|uniref:Ger(X)C family spore germination protein n=1 Tax=Oceanobacillus aidingensis TaxID=645964 RepID=A0ABV9JYI3_9BACI|nr:Ger(x)C family spore germination protein [Oceanobacillus oncorhynchi]MDM8099930.1 Ger(x)C family spore germination protein [Oceanobacillus oncorhynchi]